MNPRNQPLGPLGTPSAADESFARYINSSSLRQRYPLDGRRKVSVLSTKPRLHRLDKVSVLSYITGHCLGRRPRYSSHQSDRPLADTSSNLGSDYATSLSPFIIPIARRSIFRGSPETYSTNSRCHENATLKSAYIATSPVLYKLI